MRVANARMYSVDAAAAHAWRTLLRWVVKKAEVDVEVIDYPAPQPLPALWSRADLACAFMCGYPLSQRHPQPVVLAAPVPSPAAYGGQPVYWSNLVARKDGSIRTLDDAFGCRMAFTTPDSQSGYQAVRSLFAPYASQRRAPLFASTVGPLITPRRVVDAILSKEADIGPVDSYAYDLMRKHDPDLLAPLEIIATTMRTPIPPLVGSPDLPEADAASLTSALVSVTDAAELAAVREALQLQGFSAVCVAAYDVLRKAAEAADLLGYPRLE